MAQEFYHKIYVNVVFQIDRVSDGVSDNFILADELFVKALGRIGKLQNHIIII